MAKQLFVNNASALLAVSITTTDLTVQVASGYGALFPSPTGGDWFTLSLEDVDGNTEVTKCTARTGDSMTVVRAQEGTLAQAFTNTTTRVELRNTAGAMQRMLQRSGDTLGGDLELGGFTLSGPGFIGADVTIPKGSLFSVGMIMLWSGSLLTIPAGWALCNGTGGTPDLRDRFIIGAGGTYAPGTVGGGGGGTVSMAPAGGHTPVAQGTGLVAGNLPAHTHNVGYRGSNASTSGVDQDFVTALTDPRLDGTVLTSSTGIVGTSTPHTHVMDAVADHTHTLTLDVGSPPYYALAYIMFTGVGVFAAEVAEEPEA